MNCCFLSIKFLIDKLINEMNSITEKRFLNPARQRVSVSQSGKSLDYIA